MMHSSTYQPSSARRAGREDDMYHSESNPIYLELLSYTSTRKIKARSIPTDSWSFDDQRIWLFKMLVELCGRPDYNAYDIATRWENVPGALYELTRRDWERLLGSEKDGAIVHCILRKMRKTVKKSDPSEDDLSLSLTVTLTARSRCKWWRVLDYVKGCSLWKQSQAGNPRVEQMRRRQGNAIPAMQTIPTKT
ncbi:hypothetical protein NHQ30_000150 [Ciborinia camelliae]|nr:hypothetical protein NHQ30_000150 [Ciborinia camelliae]